MLTTKVNPPLERVARPFKENKRPFIASVLRPLARRIRENIQMEAPEESGNLRSAIVNREVNLLTYQITIDQRKRAAKYESMVRLGTRPHIIKPTKKKALDWPGASHPVKSVRHPGTKGNPYFDRGLARSQADINTTADYLGIKIMQELTGI